MSYKYKGREKEYKKEWIKNNPDYIKKHREANRRWYKKNRYTETQRRKKERESICPKCDGYKTKESNLCKHCFIKYKLIPLNNNRFKEYEELGL